MFFDSHSSTGAPAIASFLPKPFTLLLAAIVGAAFLPTQLSAQITRVDFTQSSTTIGGLNYGSSNSIVAGDFNNDGILDLVTINYSTVTFFKGLGTGKYAAPVSTTVTSGYGPVYAADFNGDGKLDLAVPYGPACCGINGVVTILLGNGDGTFTQGKSISVSTDGGPANASTIAVADFNGDHKPDIAVSDSATNYTWLFLGNGDGTFSLANSSIESNGGGNALIAGDFNGDGKEDLAFGNASFIGLYLGDGKGGFTSFSPIIAPVTNTDSLAVGDFLNSHSQQSLVALISTGISEDNGVYTYIYTLSYDKGGLDVKSSDLISGPNAEGPAFITAGDLNGDFNADLFISGGGYYSAPISEYMLGNGNGTFNKAQTTPHDTYADVLQFPIVRDLNLDSRQDVAIVWYNIPDDNGGDTVLTNTNATPNCDPPPANKLAVNICAPTSGETVDSAFTFSAAGNAFEGPVQKMELYVDGKKETEFWDDQLSESVTLSAGSHKATFYVHDNFNNTVSKSVNFTVN